MRDFKRNLNDTNPNLTFSEGDVNSSFAASSSINSA